MPPTAELRAISAARLEDARSLFDAGNYDGAVYLCGYAVELALKARICDTLDWEGYPETHREFENYRSFRTHDLRVLLRLSGAENRIIAAMPDAWKAVSTWNPDLRYLVPGSSSESVAATLLEQMRQVAEAV